MSKLLMSSVAATLIITAGGFDLDKFVKKHLAKNPNIKVEKVDLIGKKPIKNDPNWEAYMALMHLKMGKKELNIPDVIFVNKKTNLVALTLIDLKTGENLKYKIRPDMSDKYYDPKHLIAGNKDAEHKIVVFSDPQCPFCQSYVPKLIKDAKANPKKIAVYYYHAPLLQLHPVSDTLTKAMVALHHKGKVDDSLKMYKLKINPRETDEKKILKAIEKQFGIKLTSKEINDKKVLDALKHDKDMSDKMMVRGTPTVYIDGKHDENRQDYKKYINKK